jgi:hypothetical protein
LCWKNPLNYEIKWRWVYFLKIQYLIEALKVYFDYHRRTVFLPKKGTFNMDNIVRSLEEIELTEAELEVIYGAAQETLEHLRTLENIEAAGGTSLVRVTGTAVDTDILSAVFTVSGTHVCP